MPSTSVPSKSRRPTSLVVTAQPPGSVTAGSGFGLTVTAEDSSGNVDTSFNGTVTVALASNPGGATLGGTLTATAQDGVATFSDLTLDKAGSGLHASHLSGRACSSATTERLRRDARRGHSTGRDHTAARQSHGRQRLRPDRRGKDAYGNVDTNFGGSVTVGLASKPRRCHPRRHADRDGPERRGRPSPT